MRPLRTVLPTAAAVLTLALGAAACGSGTTSSSEAIAVTSTDDRCDVATTNLTPGSATFAVANEGSQVTEVYVYGEDDRIVAEVENIGPGTSRDLAVDLEAGTYEVACKPGQTGDGIRTQITVAAA